MEHREEEEESERAAKHVFNETIIMPNEGNDKHKEILTQIVTEKQYKIQIVTETPINIKNCDI